MPNRSPGGGARRTDPPADADRLADRITRGCEPLPHDFPLADADMRAAVRARLRTRLVRLLAAAIAADLAAVAQEKGHA